MSALSQSIYQRRLDEIVALLPSEPQDALTARDVHVRLGLWAKVTIRNQLHDLCSQGRVQSAVRGDGAIRYWRGAAA